MSGKRSKSSRAQAKNKRLRYELFWAGVEEAEQQPSMPFDLDAWAAELGVTRADAACRRSNSRQTGTRSTDK